VACTGDTCSGGSCVYTPDDSACDDGLWCNGAEVCNLTGCRAGTPPDCDDNISCTNDSCDENSDACVNAPIDSDSDNFTLCDTPVDCNDTNPGVNPNSTEICGNNIDEDCDGEIKACKKPGKSNGKPKPSIPTEVCGNGVCEGNETCENCESDCGACPAVCGDGICEGDENCSNCEIDCGACPAVCGDGICEGDENCSNCEIDCGACPAVCGDGKCEGDETCGNCEIDCGTCPPKIVCGDGKCEGDETCETCSEDCGTCPAQKLIINCPENVETGEIITCNVTDEKGNTVSGASVITSDGRTFTTDDKGNIQFIENQAGKIDASASKKGYIESEKAEISVKGMSWWYWVPVLIIILILLLLLPGKKKAVADMVFLEKAKNEGKLGRAIGKFNKIYVTPATYKAIMGEIKKDGRIKEVELNAKGRKYLEEVGDETVALAMQVGAKVVLAEDSNKRNLANSKGFKSLSVEEAIK